MPGNDVFLDASYAIALSAATDEHHPRAVELSEQLEANDTRMVTTRAVVLEIGNALARQRHRAAAIALIAALDSDPRVKVVILSEPLYQQAFELFRQRPDKEWGLTDCVSFVVMQERGLTDALTSDEHFRQAGFRALLKDGGTEG